jgi:hypothetical protein
MVYIGNGQYVGRNTVQGQRYLKQSEGTNDSAATQA